jgi:hypothetical protein
MLRVGDGAALGFGLNVDTTSLPGDVNVSSPDDGNDPTPDTDVIVSCPADVNLPGPDEVKVPSPGPDDVKVSSPVLDKVSGPSDLGNTAVICVSNVVTAAVLTRDLLVTNGQAYKMSACKCNTLLGIVLHYMALSMSTIR